MEMGFVCEFFGILATSGFYFRLEFIHSRLITKFISLLLKLKIKNITFYV